LWRWKDESSFVTYTVASLDWLLVTRTHARHTSKEKTDAKSFGTDSNRSTNCNERASGEFWGLFRVLFELTMIQYHKEPNERVWALRCPKWKKRWMEMRDLPTASSTRHEFQLSLHLLMHYRIELLK
jgi:hypothetical protein